MKFKELRSQFVFHRGQRIGILFLLATCIGLLYLRFFVSFSEKNTFDVSSSEIKQLQATIDSLRLTELNAKAIKIYPFNPNFITDYKAYTLGMTPEAYDKLKAFREDGKWVNSIADFKRVTQVPDSVLNAISPFFKFPEWVSRPKPKKRKWKDDTRELSFAEKRDLNEATSDELQEIHGIGNALSTRIVTLREKLGGFSDDRQLYATWGLKEEVIERLLLRFTVKKPVSLPKMNINSSSASDLATLPGISFETGKRMWEFVRVREGLTDLSELLKIDDITPRTLRVIELYLYAE